ncbi:MAG TPA: ABC transporter ATP-binding protein [Steroidobacteraceae bacterium]|nr:ABC transporter ATP-binding protein [Steroidobacteraceae bacterium]
MHKRYGAVLAVDGVSFSVPRGQILGLLGPNGAGKTSTINMILGILQPSAGTIHIEGVDLASHRSTALSHTNFAAVYAALPGNLTVRQNLRFFALLYNVAHADRRIARLLEEFELRALADTRCGLLSSGEQTRLALAKALLNEPRLLLLDEPTASLDPSAADLIRRRIRIMARERHCGILWTSHNMYEVQSTCDRVLFLSHGRVLLDGDPSALPAEHGAATLEELFIRLAREPLGADSAGNLLAQGAARHVGAS